MNRNHSRSRRLGLVAITALSVAALVGCASTNAPSTSSSTKPAEKEAHYTSIEEAANAVPIKKLCGTKKITIGMPYSDSSGYYQSEVAMARKMLKPCKNVKILSPVNANGDAQTEISNLNALVAQGADAIVTQAVFGAAQLPAFKAATKAGVKVWNYVSTPPGAVVGKDVSGLVNLSYQATGQQWADFYNKALGDKGGTLVFVGGQPGGSSVTQFAAGLAKGIEKYPNLKMVSPDPQPNNYDAGKARSVMAGLIAKYGCINGVSGDSGTFMIPILQAYNDAGCQPPVIATIATTNTFGCTWKDDGGKAPFFSLDSVFGMGLIAVRKALAEVNGITDDEPTLVAPYPVYDTLDGKDPKCDPSFPALTYWDTTLTPDELKKALGAN